MIRRVAAAWSRSRTRAWRLRGLALGLALAALLGLGAVPAFAGLQKEFSVFKFCPYENPEVSTCIYSTTTGGEFHLGSKTVPVEPKVVVLQGGLTKVGTNSSRPPTAKRSPKPRSRSPAAWPASASGAPTK